jgi:hypothetical protein
MGWSPAYRIAPLKANAYVHDKRKSDTLQAKRDKIF